MADDSDDKLRPTIAMEPIAMSERQTRELDPQEMAPIMFALTALERLGPEAIHAFRLGLLVKLQQLTREMLRVEARAELVVRASEIVDLLRRLPWEP